MPPLSSKQKGVLCGMISALLLSTFAIGIVFFHPRLFFASHHFQKTTLFSCGLLLAVPLAICIARLARHRFFNTDDIDAAAVQHSSNRARILQSILQNTLEQSVLAAFTYLAWAFTVPAKRVMTIALAACLFFIGRLLFIAFYEKGAAARSFGFALTFYPTAIMLLTMIAYISYALLFN